MTHGCLDEPPPVGICSPREEEKDDDSGSGSGGGSE